MGKGGGGGGGLDAGDPMPADEEVGRMGFLGDGGDEGGSDEHLKREREAFERELENDEELAAELNAVEEVLREGGKEMDRVEEKAEKETGENVDVDDDDEEEEAVGDVNLNEEHE